MQERNGRLKQHPKTFIDPGFLEAAFAEKPLPNSSRTLMNLNVHCYSVTPVQNTQPIDDDRV
ncbi:hypothetical protein COCOBI_pt-0650 (chloroplast) [Coccomyxa sp. Obi]|nr:hypothetical protein COCOBI_pt-0650 [Coccomyxa sp. Obi]